MKWWLSAACLCLLAGTQAFGSSQNQREHGAALFNSSGCSHCHTIRKVGGQKGPDLSGVGRALSKEKIRAQILHGGKQMPPFTDNLATSEVDDLVAYLRSCREKPKKNQKAPNSAPDKHLSQ